MTSNFSPFLSNTTCLRINISPEILKMFPKNPQKMSLKIFDFKKMTKWAFGIEQNGSNLNNIQNLIAFLGPFLVLKHVLEQISLIKSKDHPQKNLKLLKSVVKHVLFSKKMAKCALGVEQNWLKLLYYSKPNCFLGPILVIQHV